MNNEITLNRMLSSDEAARYLGIAPGTLNNWRCYNSNFIPYSRMGKKIIYKKEDLDNFTEMSRVDKPKEEMIFSNVRYIYE